MTNKSVLIAYGTRYGSTEEIVFEIEKILNNEGLATSTVNLREIEKKDWPSIDEYDAILVATGISFSRWTKESKNFLKKNINTFKLNGKKLGVFVVCGDATAPDERPKVRADFIEKVLKKLDVQADIYDAFGGVLDFSPSSPKGKLAKILLKIAIKKRGKTLEIDFNGRNDFRDWTQIQNYAQKFASLVEES
ncbi:MAG: flavodoxin domain-containing protein [Promethearchaeota archaeon]